MATQTTRRMIGKLQRAYIAAETAYGTAIDAAAAHGFRSTEIAITEERARAAVGDYPRAVEFGQVEGRQSIKGSIKSYLMSGASSAVAPDLDIAYYDFFGDKNTFAGTTINDETPSTTTATFTSVTGLEEGYSAVAFTISGVTYIRHVTDVTGSDVTWAPALPSAPANGSAVLATTSYCPIGTPSRTFTLTAGEVDYKEVVPGCVTTKMEATLKGGENNNISFDIEGQRTIRCFRDALAEALDDSETDIDVVNGDHFEVGSIIIIDSEQMKITAITDDTLTVTRGYNSTTPAAHDNSTIIYPYLPAPTTIGSPIAGILGGAYINGLIVYVKDITITMQNGRSLINDEYGAAYASGFVHSGVRSGEISLTMDLYTMSTPAAGVMTSALLYKAAKNKDAVSLAVQFGTSANHCGMFYFPQVEIDVPNIPWASAETIPTALKFKVWASGAETLDECILHFN